MRILTVARDLRRRKARERAGLFVAEGVRAVEELLASSVEVRGVLVGPQLGGTARGAALRAAIEGRGIELAEVDEADFASAAETDSPQGVLAIGAVPARGWGDVAATMGAGGEGQGPLRAAPTSLRLLVLDGVQDPGNVGTMVRTAVALGVAATVAMPGTVDLWNAKVVRSAMGALFSHAVFASSWDQFDDFRDHHAMSVWGADLLGEPLTDDAKAPDRLALVLGNEGAGLTAEARARADRLVSLRIADVESLNVAVAAGILLHELRPVPTSPAVA